MLKSKRVELSGRRNGDQSQLMCAGALLSAPAQQWYETLLDPLTTALLIHYTLDVFLAELTEFFGGGLTMASREHSLDDLRQTGSMSALWEIQQHNCILMKDQLDRPKLP